MVEVCLSKWTLVDKIASGPWAMIFIRNINFQYKYSCCNVSKCIKTSNIHVYLWFLKKTSPCIFLITNAPHTVWISWILAILILHPTFYLQHSSLLTAVALDGSQRSHISTPPIGTEWTCPVPYINCNDILKRACSGNPIWPSDWSIPQLQFRELPSIIKMGNWLGSST